MLKFAIDTLKARQADLDDLICTDIPTYNRSDISNASNEVIIRLMEDCQAFCCSFVDQTEEEEKNTDGDGGVAATNL